MVSSHADRLSTFISTGDRCRHVPFTFHSPNIVPVTLITTAWQVENLSEHVLFYFITSTEKSIITSEVVKVFTHPFKCYCPLRDLEEQQEDALQTYFFAALKGVPVDPTQGWIKGTDNFLFTYCAWLCAKKKSLGQIFSKRLRPLNQKQSATPDTTGPGL